MPAKIRPRPWFPLDTDYFNQPSIRALGDEFGPAGPLAFLLIVTEAKRAAIAGLPVSEQGRVSVRYRAIAQTSFLDSTTSALAIVDACEREELLERLPESTDARLVARLTKWSLWEPSDATAAERKRRQRQRTNGSDSEFGF